jgi:hypothetical protein
MRRIMMLAATAALLLANDGGCDAPPTSGQERQTKATNQAMNAADRETGFPRIVNFAQRKLLKNAYEDMDQTVLTYVYTQGMDGKFACLGQALGYGVSTGTQFTAPYYNQSGGNCSYYQVPQADPNMLYMPSSGEATIVDLIDPRTGQAHTAIMEPRIVTVPFELAASAVSAPCPEDIDPAKVRDVKEHSVAAQATH